MFMKRLLSNIFRKKKFPIASAELEPEIQIEKEPEYIIDSSYDEETGVLRITHIVCLCGWSAAYFESGADGYWCEHCDRPCTVGLPLCGYCEELVNTSVEDVRRAYEESEDDED